MLKVRSPPVPPILGPKMNGGCGAFSPIRHVVSHRLQSADSSRSLELVVAERARPLGS